MSTEVARQPTTFRWSAVTGALQSGPLLPSITLALLLVALAVLVGGGTLGHRAVPSPRSLPADGPPPRMAAVAVSVAS